MNHTYRKSSLALVALLALTGCRSGAVESAETVAPEETPAVTPAKAADDGTEATPASVGLTQAMLDELAKGYQMESTVVTTSMDGDTASYQSWALECAATDGKYSAKSWELCETEVPTKNAVDQFFYATYDPSEATKNTYSVKLGINNKLVYTPIKDSNGDVQVWEKGGFSNFWADLSISDFDYTDEDNTFSLYAYDANRTLAYTELCDQIGGGTGWALGGMKMKTDGRHVTDIETTFQDITEYGTTFSTKVTTKVTAYGTAAAVEDINPIEGTEDADFAAAMDSLRQSNFICTTATTKLTTGTDGTVTRTLSGTTVMTMNPYEFKFESKDATGTLTARPQAGFQIGNHEQGCLVYGDTVYDNGATATGSIAEDFTPSFAVSSLLFSVDAATKTYTLNVPNYHLASDYTHLVSSSLKGHGNSTFSVVLKEGEVDFTFVTVNSETSAAEYAIAYTSIGTVEDVFDVAAVKNDCSDLKFSELLFYKQNYLATLIKACVNQDTLDSIPTLGGIYSNCTASTGCVVYASFLTVEEFDGAVTAYKAKLVAAGYTASATAGKHGGVVYTKAITIKDSSNADVAYTLSLEVYPRKLTFMGVNLTMLYLYPTATIVKA
jgi:hypothetical protein